MQQLKAHDTLLDLNEEMIILSKGKWSVNVCNNYTEAKGYPKDLAIYCKSVSR